MLRAWAVAGLPVTVILPLHECRLWVASRRWAATDGFHRLNGRKRPKLAIRCVRRKGPVIDQKAVVERLQLGRGNVTQIRHSPAAPGRLSVSIFDRYRRGRYAGESRDAAQSTWHKVA
jgi:hypothetical protein